MLPDILLAGASCRAAAVSAARAGLRVAAVDLFADIDTAAVADVCVLTSWPQGVAAWAERFPATIPFAYVGGLENYPNLLDAIAATRPLAGIAGEPLRAVRNPFGLAARADAAGLPRLAVRHSTAPPAAGRWLVKPMRGAGGNSVRWWSRHAEPVDEASYFQAYCRGQPASAAFLATASGVELLGATLLLRTQGHLHASRPFQYLGNLSLAIGPAEPLALELTRLGEVLGAGLRGLFGIDFICGKQGVLPVELNPRYTAGMEVLERRSGRSFLGEHLRCFGANVRLPPPATTFAGLHGKRIVYAERPRRVGRLPVPQRTQMLSQQARIADIPAPETVVVVGEPICTVFAVAETLAACRAALGAAGAAVLSQSPPLA